MKITLIVIGYVFVGIFIVSHLGEDAINALLIENEVRHKHFLREYGDLYYMTHIDRFKTKLDENRPIFRESKENLNVDEAHIIIIGDSYFDFNKFKNIPERFSDDLGMHVSFNRTRRPLPILKHANQAEIILIELSERFFYDMFKPEILYDQQIENPISLQRKVKNILFPSKIENRYNLLLRRSYLTNDVYNFIKTNQYEWFDLNIEGVHVSKDKRHLFLSDYLEGNQPNNIYLGTDYHFEDAYENLKKFNQSAITLTGIKPIFIIIPNKGTIMHDSKNQDYNNFLPKLHQKLETDSIEYVDIYKAFKNSDEQLYYSTDTHWNEDGAKIAFEQIMVYLLEKSEEDWNFD